jgi:hypothetical protein
MEVAMIKRKTSTASTAIVYGCLNASLTIQIAQIPPADNQSAQLEALQLEYHELGNKPAKRLRANELATFTRLTGQRLFNLLNKEAVGLLACCHLAGIANSLSRASKSLLSSQRSASFASLQFSRTSEMA